jgi:hypothetical protein
LKAQGEARRLRLAQCRSLAYILDDSGKLISARQNRVLMMASHRFLVVILSLAACFMSTGCFSCSLSTSETSPASSQAAYALEHTLSMR